MANPYGITEFDAAGAFSALQSARQNRIREMLLQRQIQAEERQERNRTAFGEAIRAYGGGPAPATAPAPDVAAGGVAPASAGEALPAPEPRSAPADGHHDLARLGVQLMAIDPDVGAQVFNAFRQMDEAQFEAAQRRVQVRARAAFELRHLPEAERPARFQLIAPDLIAQGGVTRDELEHVQLTDAYLDHLITSAQDVDKLAEAARPDYVNVNGELVDRNALARGDRDPVAYRSEYIDTPQGLARRRNGGVAREPVRVSTPEEARRLPPGTPIILPDGSPGVVPGGPPAPPAGTFP